MDSNIITMSHRQKDNNRHWVAVIANDKRKESAEGSDKKQLQIEDVNESAMIRFMRWSYNSTWRLMIVLSVYVSVLVTLLMQTHLIDIIVLFIIQELCTFLFAIDFVLALMHRIVHIPSRIFSVKRSIKWMLIEAISLIPLPTFYMIIINNPKMENMFWLSILLFLRFYRLPIYFNDVANCPGIRHSKYTIFRFTLYAFLSVLLFSILWMKIADVSNINIKHWSQSEPEIFLVSLYFSSMTFINIGFGDISAATNIEKFVCMLAMLVGFVLTTGVLISALTTHMLKYEKPREIYRREHNGLYKKMKYYKVNKEKERRVLHDLNLLWEYKRGVSNRKAVDFLPASLKKEISFDVNYGLLSRSLIFSVQKRSFLRSIANIMKNETYLPGDMISCPTGIFRGMICVISGIVEVLSTENDDTPLISFTSGTILGEISLFLAIPINIVIRAATIVEIQLLESIEFCRLALKYRENYASMREDILKRYQASLGIELNAAAHSLDPEMMGNFRLKSLKFLIQEWHKRFDEVVEDMTVDDAFTRKILHTYVLIENLPRVKTLSISLIKHKPWILRPNTSFTHLWNIIMFFIITLVIFYYPYLAAFKREMGHFEYVVVVFADVAYISDLILQIHTAIPRDDLYSYETKIKDIILHKLKNYGFFLDVLSAYELGVFAPLFQSAAYDYTFLLLSQNKILKVWRIPAYFKLLEDNLSVSFFVLRIVKYIYYLVWYLNFSAAIVYLEACPTAECDPLRWFRNAQEIDVELQRELPMTDKPYIVSFYVALMLTTTAGFGNVKPTCLLDIGLFLCIMIGGLLVISYILAELSVTFKHSEERKTLFQEQIFAIDRFLLEHAIPQEIRGRVLKFFRVQWEYDEGSSLTGMRLSIPLDSLPRKQAQLLLNEKLQVLRAVPIFKNANPGFMLVLAEGCKTQVLPENEMVVRAGSLDREMFIIQSGYVQIYTSRTTHEEVTVIGPYTSFGDLEMIQGIPISTNARTLTHSSIICIEYATYMRGVTEFPNVRQDIERLIVSQKVKKMTNTPMYPSEFQVPQHNQPLCKRLWKPLTDSLINVYKYDKKRNRKYWKPFSSWNKLRFLCIFVLPISIKPNSLLLRVWVAFRVITSLIVGFIAPIYFALPKVTFQLTGLVVFLQTVTLCDLYITLHIAYYNENGLLVFHPSKTVVHYIKGAFFLDLLLAFPFFWIGDRLRTNKDPNILYNGPGLIKVLQYYKFLQACNFNESDILKRSMILKLLKYLPTLLIFTNLLTALLLLVECHVSTADEVVGPEDTVLTRYRRYVVNYCHDHSTSKPTDEINMYLIAFYYISASLTTCGFGDVHAISHVTQAFSIIMVMFGLFIYSCMFASIASSKIFAFNNVFTYRAKIKEMITFLERHNIDELVKRRFYMHYMHNWMRTYGYAPQETLSDIHTMLKQDIVIKMYETTLRKVSLFARVDKSFIGSLGKYLDEIYFLQGETICQHHHIQLDIYIIYRGTIEILDENGEYVTSMGAGGIFGNLSSKHSVLSQITAVAATKIELIRIRNEDFNKALSIYPHLLRQMATLTRKTPHYIVPYAETEYFTLDDFDTYIPDEEGEKERIPYMFEKGFRGRGGEFYLKRSIFVPSGTSRWGFRLLMDSTLYNYLRILQVFCSWISCIANLYAFAFQDHEIYVMVLCYIPDFVFYVIIPLEFCCTYVDVRGDHIYNRRLIRERYMKSKRILIDIIANIPLEILVVLAPREDRMLLLTVLRMNRIIRFYYIMEYYNLQANKLMVYIPLVEMGVLLAWMSVMIHFIACIWYISACPLTFCFEKSWITELNWAENPDKFDYYITSIYFTITLVTTTGYGDVVPVTRTEVVVSTIMIIVTHIGLVLGAVTFLSMIGVNELTFVKYEETISQYRRDLTRQKISRYQLKKLWRYAQLLWWRNYGKQIPYFIESAPYIMKCEVYNAMFGEHLRRSYIFTDLDEHFIRQVASHMIRYVFFPGNYIVHQGDTDSTMYFIHKGKISVLSIHLDLMETVHYHMKTDDQFGISQGLISGESHLFSYRAETEVELIALTLEHWQHLFRYFPQVKKIIYKRLEYLK